MLGIRIPVPCSIPLRGIRDIRQDQCRGNRVQELTQVKRTRGVGPAGVKIGEIFSGSTLGRDALRELGSVSAYGNDLDTRKLSVKGRHNIRVRDLLPAVKRKPALFFGS